MSVTGFTLELDGPPEYIERIMHAAMAEHAQVIRDATAERDSWLVDSFGTTYRPLRFVNPVHGTISVRSKL